MWDRHLPITVSPMTDKASINTAFDEVRQRKKIKPLLNEAHDRWIVVTTIQVRNIIKYIKELRNINACKMSIFQCEK